MERDLVLGTEDGEAWVYIEWARARMREAWKEYFERMVQAECREYGENSYFKQFNRDSRRQAIDRCT